MRNNKLDEFSKACSIEPSEIGCHSPKKFSYDGVSQRLPTESPVQGTVIWIAKDSESKSEEYLEECNTRQNGE